MTTADWTQILVLTLVVGALVSKTSHLVLSRVTVRGSASASHEPFDVGNSGGADNRGAVEELAAAVGVNPSDIRLTLTADHEVHCSIQAAPDGLLELAASVEAAVDETFLERHRWAGARVVLHLDTGP